MSKVNIKNSVIGAGFLLLAYAIGSRALDTGSYWEYLGCVVALAFSIKFIVHALHANKYGKKV